MPAVDYFHWAQGKRVVISGGDSGLGAAIATRLATMGAEVWSIDRNSEPRREQHDAGSICYRQGDITIESDVETFVEELSAHGATVDMLVNNAGIGGQYAPVQDLDIDDFRRVLEVNVLGQVILSQKMIPHLVPASDDVTPASVVFMSSAAGRLGYPMRSPYAASKWGVVGLVKSLAWELGPLGIRVNAVLPGIVDTPLARSVLADRSAALGTDPDELWQRFLSRNTLPTPVVVDDVVNAVTYLLSPLSGHVSGQALSVDGGADSIAVMD